MEKETGFEEAYQRLEQILEKMHMGEINLDQSLQLYEEADRLIRLCSDRLDKAEAKIQKIVKDQNGTAVFDLEGNLELETMHD